MEFLLFLNAKDEVIVNLVNKANFTFEENTPLCLLGDRYIGFTKRKQRRVVICTQNAKNMGGSLMSQSTFNDGFNMTPIYIRRALRHEAIHVAQLCNSWKPLAMKVLKKEKIHPFKKTALANSTKISGDRTHEYEAYLMEDRPKLVKKALSKFCF